MGQINLKGKVQNVFGKQRLVTRAERYSTIGSELIVARVAQTAGIKEANVQGVTGTGFVTQLKEGSQ